MLEIRDAMHPGVEIELSRSVAAKVPDTAPRRVRSTTP